MFHSISWRLQISYGLLLLAAFVALGITAYHLERTSRMSAIDGGIQSRATQLTNALFRLRTQAPDSSSASKTEPGELVLPRHNLRFGPDAERPHYYFIWGTEAKPPLLYRSQAAPENVAPPDFAKRSYPRGGFPRIQEERRERIYRTRSGFVILVGRDVKDELAAIRSYVIKLALAGVALLLAGLIVSYWVAKRALRPITDISKAAARIAGGELNKRIETTGNRSELGRLSNVLNHTFDKLENAYRRQAQFTADASHELRTPVSVILTEIQSAPKESRSIAEYEECLTVCEEAATSMQLLLQQLMALAQFDAGKGLLIREDFDLQEIVERCVDQIGPLAKEKGISITRDLGSPVFCKGDPDRLSQVITNLLGNAIAYNAQGGNVAIELACEPDQAAVLTVADTGPGISPDDLPHLFERFYRADKSRSSGDGHSGLGLAICQEIADAHGGNISVESELDKGSIFTLKIPLPPGEVGQ